MSYSLLSLYLFIGEALYQAKPLSAKHEACPPLEGAGGGMVFNEQ